ncbi:MAG: hypothetical protein P8Y99_18995 [Calditrichaceae bacterium]
MTASTAILPSISNGKQDDSYFTANVSGPFENLNHYDLFSQKPVEFTNGASASTNETSS